MRTNVLMVIYILFSYINFIEGEGIFKTIGNFFKPRKQTTTLAPVWPTSQASGSNSEDRTYTTPHTWYGDEVSAKPFIDKNVKDKTNSEQQRTTSEVTPNTYSQRPFLSNKTSELVNSNELTNSNGPKDYEMTTINIYNYITQSSYSNKPNIARPDHTVSSYESTTVSNLYNNNNNGFDASQTQFENSNNTRGPIHSIYNQQDITPAIHNTPKTPIQEEISNGQQPVTFDAKNTSYNKNKVLEQNQPTSRNNNFSQDTRTTIQVEEGGPIVYPTESEKEANSYVERQQYDYDVNKTATTVRTPKSGEPVPVDGGRTVINAPSKTCGQGQRLQDGVCRTPARK